MNVGIVLEIKLRVIVAAIKYYNLVNILITVKYLVFYDCVYYVVNNVIVD